MIILICYGIAYMKIAFTWKPFVKNIKFGSRFKFIEKHYLIVKCLTGNLIILKSKYAEHLLLTSLMKLKKNVPKVKLLLWFWSATGWVFVTAGFVFVTSTESGKENQFRFIFSKYYKILKKTQISV